MNKKCFSKIIASIAMVFMFLAVLTGCAGGYKSGNEVGKYYFDYDNNEYTITLKEEGKIDFKVKGKDLTGSYSLDGNDMLIKLSDGTKISVTYTDEVLKFKYDNIDMSFVRDILYTVTFNTNGGSKVVEASVKNGRTVAKPIDPTKDHYEFVGWFKDQALKEAFNFATEKVTSDITLYGKWAYKAAVNTLTYTKAEGMTLANEAVKVTEGEDYILEVPTFADKTLAFTGWYTEDGIELTDSTGKSLKPWEELGDIKIVAKTELNLTYTELADGTYKASGNENTAKLREIKVPAYHNSKKVTAVDTFAGHENLETLNLPATITFVEPRILEGLVKVKAINVYEVEGVSEAAYSANAGVLYKDGGKVLALYPVAKEDLEFKIPASVSEIGDYAFADVTAYDKNSHQKIAFGKLQKIILPRNLTRVGEYAFSYRGNLRTVEFTEGGQLPLTFARGAFFSASISNLILPENLVEIGDQCFALNQEFLNFKLGNTELVIPNSVKRIGDRAFYYQGEINYENSSRTGISTVIIGSGVEEIGREAFSACYNLREVSFVGEAKLAILREAVFQSTNLSEFIIPASVTTILADAFYGTKISALVIPSNVTTLGDRALAGMGDLEAITIPETVTSFGANVFAECDSLYIDQITFAEGFKGAVIKDGVIYDSKEETILYFYPLKETYVMPNTVKYIPAGIFAGGSLMEITLSNQLEVIGAGAFADSSLQSIVIPASVKRIEKNALAVWGLESITFEAGSQLEYIGDEAFMSTEITSIELSGTLKEIGKNAFMFTKIQNLVIPDSVTAIGDGAFKEIEGLTSVTLPASLVNLGENIFESSKGLKEIKLSADAKNFKVVDNVLYTKDNSDLIKYVGIEARKEYKVLAGTKKICAGAFADITLDQLELDESVTEISELAFANNKISSFVINSQAQADMIVSGKLLYVNPLGKINADSIKIKEGITLTAQVEKFLADNDFTKAETANGYVLYSHK